MSEHWDKCYTCERELSETEKAHSHEVSGLSLCPVCLEEEMIPKDRCYICHKLGIELNTTTYSDGKKICRECFLNLQGKGVNTMSELQEYIKRNSRTIFLKDGEKLETVYQGFKIGANRFDPEKESIYYNFETEYGIKQFQSGSIGLAKIFDSIEKGEKIRLTRHGEGNKTKYTIERVNADGSWEPATLETIVEEE